MCAARVGLASGSARSRRPGMDRVSEPPANRSWWARGRATVERRTAPRPPGARPMPRTGRSAERPSVGRGNDRGDATFGAGDRRLRTGYRGAAKPNGLCPGPSAGVSTAIVTRSTDGGSGCGCGTSLVLNSWRRGWDSNPRGARPCGFQDRSDKPLRHLSAVRLASIAGHVTAGRGPRFGRAPARRRGGRVSSGRRRSTSSWPPRSRRARAWRDRRARRRAGRGPPSRGGRRPEARRRRSSPRR